MLKKIVILVCFLFAANPFFAQITPQSARAQVQHAKITLRAIGKQIERFYTIHKKMPNTNDSETKFFLLGISLPTQTSWDYFFKCTAKQCKVDAERKRKFYGPDDVEGITPILRLTVNGNKTAPLIIMEARTVWFMQRKDTTVLMEQTYPAPLEVCQWFGGHKRKDLGCVLE